MEIGRCDDSPVSRIDREATEPSPVGTKEKNQDEVLGLSGWDYRGVLCLAASKVSVTAAPLLSVPDVPVTVTG